MSYDDSTDTGAADELESQDTSENSGGYTCYLPAHFPGADALKAGDTITLKVVGKDADGDIEVEHADSKPESKSMMDHFDREVMNKS